MQAYYQKQHELNHDFYINILTGREFSIGEHFHSNIELTYVIEGEITAVVKGDRITMTEGDLYFTLGYESHGFQMTENSSCYVLMIPEFMVKSFKSYLGTQVFNSNYLPKNEKSPVIKRCLNDLMNELHPLTKKGYLYIILGILLEKLELTESKVKKEPPTVSKLLKFLEDNFLYNIKVDDLAKAMGYSSSYISSMFNASFDCSFNKYLNTLRARHGAYLFSQGQRNILEVALSSGFNSLRTFNRAFREEFDMAPREYIQKIQKTNESQKKILESFSHNI